MYCKVMQKKIISIFLCLACISVVFVSCKKTAEDYDLADKAIVNLDSLEHNFNFYSMFPYDRMVFLELTSDSRVADINRIYAIDSLFIVWDQKSDAVFVFNDKGKFLYRIGDKGHTEKEYASINDVYVDQQNKQVYLLDNASHKIQCFGLEGSYMRTIRTKEWALGFAVDEDYIWLESDGQNQSSALLLKTDAKSGDVIETYFPMLNDGRVPIKSEKTFFADAEGDIFFCSPYLNSIYKIKDGEIAPLLTLDFGSDGLDDSDLTSEAYISTISGKNYIGNIGDVFLCKDNLFISFQRLNDGIIEKYNALYSLASKELHIYDDSLLHDFQLSIFPSTNIVGVGKHSIIYSIDPSLYPDESVAGLPDDEYNTKDKYQMNPVLVIYDVN